MLLTDLQYMENPTPRDFERLMDDFQSHIDFEREKYKMLLLAERRRKIDIILETPTTKDSTEFIINNWIKK